MDDLHNGDTTANMNVAMENKDDNKSSSSGSSSETTNEPVKGAEPKQRHHRRHSKAKRKRKWKPYTEMTNAEREVQDERETKRALAKRERLSAEGHPIAPYNTTQFLMEDHKPDSSDLMMDTTKESDSLPNSGRPSPMRRNLEHLNMQNGVDSPVLQDNHYKTDREMSDYDAREDIHKFIMRDFSHTYADAHAEQLQGMTKPQLVNECLKLERRVESLERKVNHCRKRHREPERNQADMRLLEKINHLQMVNSQLVKENASMSAVVHHDVN